MSKPSEPLPNRPSQTPSSLSTSLESELLPSLSSTQSKLAQSILSVSEDDVSSTLEFTDAVIKTVGPRLAGSKRAHKAAKILFEEMTKIGDHTHLEKFEIHPDSFLSVLPVIATSYLVSSVLLLIGGVLVYLALLGYIFGALYTLMQFILYEKTFDPFFPKKKGYNVSTVIEPTEEVRQQIILSGHHDSAYIFNYIEHHPKLYTFRLYLGIIVFAITFIFALYWAIFRMFSGSNPSIDSIIRFGVILGSLVVVQYYFFKSRKGSPGAGDNLISSVIAMKVGQKFSLSKRTRSYPLKHTRLIILSNDAEECGLRGAATYCKKHKEELLSIPTYNVNMDSLYKVKDLKIMTTDINGTVKLSAEMAHELQDLFASLGYSSTLFPLLFGAGGTDSAEFAKIGVDAATIIAVPTEFETEEEIFYHTSRDTVENIEPEVVSAVISVLIRYILEKEKKVITNH